MGMAEPTLKMMNPAGWFPTNSSSFWTPDNDVSNVRLC